MAIPQTLGWYEIPNTKLRSVVPGGDSNNQAGAIVGAWSGGCFDTLRNRLIVWGGGHNDYYGNEVYALNLSGTPSVERLTNGCESPNGFNEVCTGSNPPQPQSRHTYGFIEYIPTIDAMFTTSYAWDTKTEWIFDFATLSWHQLWAMPRPSSWYGIQDSAMWDPVTAKLFLEELYAGFCRYDPVANGWTRLGSINDYTGYGNGCVLDPVRRKVFAFGAGIQAAYDLTGTPDYGRHNISTNGGSAIVGADNPGLAYDPTTGLIVGWAGGDTVYTFNPDTMTWTPHTFSGGPGAQQLRGTFGRWRYVPAFDVFVILNDVDQNAFTFRLNSLNLDTTPPTTPSNLTANAVSPTQINLSWTGSTDMIGVTGYLLERCFSPGCNNFAQVATPMTTAYSDTGRTPATVYRYRVRATDAAHNLSEYSEIAEATTGVADTEPPTDPSNLQATVNSYAQITLNWTASTDNVGVHHYDVERCSGSGCSNFTVIASTQTNNYVNGGLTANTAYRYRVRAFDLAGNASGYSSIVSGTTLTAGILQVGPSKPYATLSAAVAAAVDGDTIEMDAGTYPNDSCTIIQQNITIRGVGGYAKLKWDTGDHQSATNNIPNGQGIIKFNGSGLIENLEFCGAVVADANGAGIRYYGGNLIIRHCWFHNNQNGIMGESYALGPTLTIEHSIFDSNGWFDGTYYSHNVYIGYMHQVVFRFNKSINPIQGHCFKSRAGVNQVEYNYFSTKNSAGSLECEFPNGHQAIVIGNILEQGDGSENSTMLSYAAEGKTNFPDVVHELYAINNTFYNWRSSGVTFIQMVQSPTYAKIMNNARNAANTWLSGSAATLVESNNIVLGNSDWVAVDNGDFHLTQGAAAIDAGTDPGTATVLGQGYALSPAYEYTHS